MKQVAIIITEDGYSFTLDIKGKTYIQKWRVSSTGSHCIEDTFNEIEDTMPELYEEITQGFTAYNIMRALINNP